MSLHSALRNLRPSWAARLTMHGDGAHVLVAGPAIYAADDCDGRAVELDRGEVVQELDLFGLDREPMDYVSEFEWPWLVGGSSVELLYRLNDLDRTSLAVSDDVTLLVPV